MKLELDSKSMHRVRVGDIVTVREVRSYCNRDEDNGPYATIHRMAHASFDTGNGAMDHYRREATVRRIVNDGMAVVI
jgi:hypothetical protein